MFAAGPLEGAFLCYMDEMSYFMHVQECLFFPVPVPRCKSFQVCHIHSSGGYY